MDQSHSSKSHSRSLVEKNRRIQMKNLCSELNSLLPHQSSRESLTLPDQLDEATKYIKKLQVNVEKKRERKKKLVASSSMSSSIVVDVFVPRRLPKLEIQETGSTLQIFLVTSIEHKFMFHEIIRVLNEELGSEIIHAGYSIVDDSVFHTLHCQVDYCEYGAGSRISERLKKFVNNVTVSNL